MTCCVFVQLLLTQLIYANKITPDKLAGILSRVIWQLSIQLFSVELFELFREETGLILTTTDWLSHPLLITSRFKEAYPVKFQEELRLESAAGLVFSFFSLRQEGIDLIWGCQGKSLERSNMSVLVISDGPRDRCQEFKDTGHYWSLSKTSLLTCCISTYANNN